MTSDKNLQKYQCEKCGKTSERKGWQGAWCDKCYTDNIKKTTMTNSKTASALSTNYFKLQKEINELVEKQDEIKKEIQSSYENERFDKIETLLGTVNVVVSGGAQYTYQDSKAKREASLYEEKLSKISDKKKELSDASKELTEESKEPKKALGEIQKKFGEKHIPDDAKTSLRFTPNR